MSTRTDVIQAWAAETVRRGHRVWWRDLIWDLRMHLARRDPGLVPEPGSICAP